MFGIVAFEDVDVFHGAAPLRQRGYNVGPFLRKGLPPSLRERACRGPSSPFGLRRGSLRYERACRAEAGDSNNRSSRDYDRFAEARLRLSGYDAAAFATRWLAEPKLAKPAKAGGARRDRTADLLHAMQALSQLSY